MPTRRSAIIRVFILILMGALLIWVAIDRGPWQAALTLLPALLIGLQAKAPVHPPVPGEKISKYEANRNRRITRGIPELRDESDFQRASIVRQVLRENRAGLSASAVITGIAVGAVLIPLALVVSMGGDEVLRHLLGHAPGAWDQSPWRGLSVLPAALLGAAALWSWFALRHRFIRGLLLERFRRASDTCTRCRYDLAALREQGPVVTCPECGMANRFDSWTEGYAALIAKKGASHTPPPSAHAAESLAAQPLAAGSSAPQAQAPAPPATSPDPSLPPRSA